MAKKVRITVLKKQFHEDLAERFLMDSKDAVCPEFDEGDVFLFEGRASMPEGFCKWAWLDIGSKVISKSNGASCYPWYNRSDIAVECCSDGIRPVSFLLERLEEDC